MGHSDTFDLSKGAYLPIKSGQFAKGANDPFEEDAHEAEDEKDGVYWLQDQTARL